MRLLHALLLIPLFCAPAYAAGESATAEHRGRRSAAEHFADANTTHDGKLTLEQAQSGYKSLAKSFARIDIGHRGYITMDDIKAWRAAKKAAKRAAAAADTTDDGTVRPVPAMQQGERPREIDTSTGLAVPGAAGAPRTGIDLPKAPLDNPHAS